MVYTGEAKVCSEKENSMLPPGASFGTSGSHSSRTQRTTKPDHVLLRAAWDDAADGLIDIHRLGALLKRIKGQLLHRALDTVSPLAVPVLLEIARESIYGEAHDALLAEASGALVNEAMGLV